MAKTALIIVDYQNDFLPPNGALAVPEGTAIQPIIEGLLKDDKWEWDLVIASQDYHPPKHISFASRHPPHKPFSDLQVTDGRGTTYVQTLWPDHCVQGTKGAEIEKGLRKCFEPWKGRIKIVRKAWHPDVEAYSAFEGYITEATDPAEPPEADPGARPIEESEVTLLLRELGIEKVVIVGLATDFCVKHTSLASLQAGFDTVLIAPAVRGVDKGKEEEMLDMMQSKGATVVGRKGEEWEQAVKRWRG